MQDPQFDKKLAAMILVFLVMCMIAGFMMHADDTLLTILILGQMASTALGVFGALMTGSRSQIRTGEGSTTSIIQPGADVEVAKPKEGPQP